MAKKPHPVDVHVGGRLRMRRMLLGLSQDKLGDSLGLTFQQIQKYEKGANRIGASRIFEMADVLGVPIQYFYDDFMPRNGPAYGFAEADSDAFMALLHSPDGIQLCRYYSEIKDAKLRKKVLELVKTLAQNSTEDA
jgi:transcriptional regulator with XRE-family HTH domain